MYHFVCKFFQEGFEVKGISSNLVADFLQCSENNLEFCVKTQSLSSHQNISDISSSLSWVSIKRKHWVKVSNEIKREDWVLSSNIFSQDSFQIFLLLFSSGQSHQYILLNQYNLIAFNHYKIVSLSLTKI